MSVLKLRPCISVLTSIILIILPLFTIITPIISDNTAYALAPDSDLSNADASFHGEYIDQLGSDITGVGDVNGDGFDDILIGVERNDEGGTDSGQTYLIFGR